MHKFEFQSIAKKLKISGIENFIANNMAADAALVVSGVPALWQGRFRSHGFAVYAQYHDYWIDTLIAPGRAYSDFNFLPEADCAAASEVTVACRGRSRGFEGESPQWFMEWLRGENDLHNPAVLIRRMNNRIAGLACTATYAHGSKRGAVAWVRLMAVHPDFQGRGIGKTLLMQTLQYGAEHGAKRAFLHADTENPAALRIYKSAGFLPRKGEGQTDMIWKNESCFDC